MSDCFDPKKCGYKTRVTYEILEVAEDGTEGCVRNKVVDDLSWPANAQEAIAHKYAFFSLVYGKGEDGRARVHAASDAALGN